MKLARVVVILCASWGCATARSPYQVTAVPRGPDYRTSRSPHVELQLRRPGDAVGPTDNPVLAQLGIRCARTDWPGNGAGIRCNLDGHSVATGVQPSELVTLDHQQARTTLVFGNRSREVGTITLSSMRHRRRLLWRVTVRDARGVRTQDLMTTRGDPSNQSTVPVPLGTQFLGSLHEAGIACSVRLEDFITGGPYAAAPDVPSGGTVSSRLECRLGPHSVEALATHSSWGPHPHPRHQSEQWVDLARTTAPPAGVLLLVVRPGAASGGGSNF